MLRNAHFLVLPLNGGNTLDRQSVA